MEIKSVIENFNEYFGCEVEVRPGEEPVLRPDGGTMSWRVHSPEPHSIGFGVEVKVGGWFWVEFKTGDWGCEIELVVESYDGVAQSDKKGGVSTKYWYLENEDGGGFWEGPSNFVFG